MKDNSLELNELIETTLDKINELKEKDDIFRTVKFRLKQLNSNELISIINYLINILKERGLVVDEIMHECFVALLEK